MTLEEQIEKDLKDIGWVVLSQNKHNNGYCIKLWQRNFFDFDVKDFYRFTWIKSYYETSDRYLTIKTKQTK